LRTTYEQVAQRRDVLIAVAINGATRPLLSAPVFDGSMIAGLVNQGLAILTREQIKAGGKLVDAKEQG